MSEYLNWEESATKPKRNFKQLRAAAKIMGYTNYWSDDFMISRGLQWLAERGTIEINHHPEGYSLSCWTPDVSNGASIIYEHLADAVAECILNVHYDEINGN